MNIVKLNSIADVSSGQGAPQGDSSYSVSGIPFIKAGSLEELMGTNDEYQSCNRVNESVAKQYRLKKYPANTIVFAKSGMSAMKGRVYCLNNSSYVVNHLATIIPDESRITPRYLKYFFQVFSPTKLIKDRAYPSIRLEDIGNIQITLRPIEEQNEITSILDQADSLRSKRKQAIELLDEYIKSVFIEMFGHPIANSKKLEMMQLNDICRRLSDGPFGSKLKSAHYVEKGVRVIRLQNIGVNKFIDKDKAYISEDYYQQELHRYTCKPGDIVIATLGDPNIRACLIPDDIKVSINKADCVHCVPNDKYINSIYLVNLLNLPQFQHTFLNLVHGQTRGRISSGQLKKVYIPVPKIDSQNNFAKIVQDVEAIKQKMLSQSYQLDNQFQALMQKSFQTN